MDKWHNNYTHDVIRRLNLKAVKMPSGCIEYRAGECKHEYGLISITIDGKRKSVPAHRAMYMALNNCLDLPRSTVIRHKCDNPPCINPDHLLPGTHKENSADMIKRGRKAKAHAPHTRQRKLTPEQVLGIRNAAGNQSDIARDYGISIGYVSKIKSGKAKALIK